MYLKFLSRFCGSHRFISNVLLFLYLKLLIILSTFFYARSWDLLSSSFLSFIQYFLVTHLTIEDYTSYLVNQRELHSSLVKDIFFRQPADNKRFFFKSLIVKVILLKCDKKQESIYCIWQAQENLGHRSIFCFFLNSQTRVMWVGRTTIGLV